MDTLESKAMMPLNVFTDAVQVRWHTVRYATPCPPLRDGKPVSMSGSEGEPLNESAGTGRWQPVMNSVLLELYLFRIGKAPR